MEKKTIGCFIAALRKANGMTQKDLAEKLNVSDKTVSRWERDDGAPDLAAIVQIKPDPFCTRSDRSILSERKLYGKTDVLPESYFKTLDAVRYLKSRLSIADSEGDEQP